MNKRVGKKVIVAFFSIFACFLFSQNSQAQTIEEQETVSISAYVAPGNVIIFSGTTCPTCQVTLLRGGQTVDTELSAGDGTFQITVNDFDAGTYVFGLYSVDTEGAQSATTSVLVNISVSQGQLILISDILLAPTLSSNKDTIEPEEEISFFGQTAPNSEVTIYIDSTFLTIQVTADSNGDFSYTLDTSDLGLGTHSAQARAELGGDISTLSRTIEFDVEVEDDDDYDDEDDDKNTCEKADYDDNGRVNIVDFSILIYWYKDNKVPNRIDLNDDNDVDLIDFSILMYCWTG